MKDIDSVKNINLFKINKAMKQISKDVNEIISFLKEINYVKEIDNITKK